MKKIISNWKLELKRNIISISDLKDYLGQSINLIDFEHVAENLPISVTLYYLSLIDKNDPDDPIRKMIMPSIEELSVDGTLDVSGEAENTKFLGLQHKYTQTVLILATNRCASYCRFCFRKRLVGRPNSEILDNFQKAVDYISEHPEVTNVLISGGDPLILDTKVIDRFLNQLTKIPHLDFIRIGTRIPVVFPNRILTDNNLLKMIGRYNNRKKIYIVTHFNHPKELTIAARKSINRFKSEGIMLSNQTVLLKGVNDNSNVLAELQRKLVKSGVIPYYVFQCRPVKGTKHHFQVPLIKGIKIVKNAKKQLDGHSKRFRYIMAHKTGKIEILGTFNNNFLFKYHQATNNSNFERFFTRKISSSGKWLDDLSE